MTSAISQFPAKLLLEADFANFLDATAKSCIQCVAESDTTQWGIRDTYLNHLETTEASFNEQHAQSLKIIIQNFEIEFAELNRLAPEKYREMKARTLYEEEQKLLYEERTAQTSRQYIDYLPLKQTNGEFTKQRWLYLIAPTLEVTENEKAMILDEKGDASIVQELFYPIKSVKQLFSVFAIQALEHLQKTTKGILQSHSFSWEKGKIIDHKETYNLLSSNEKQLLLSYSLIIYATALKTLQKEGITPYKSTEIPLNTTSCASFNEIQIVFDTTSKQVFHLNELLSISSLSPRSKTVEAIDNKAVVFYKHLRSCKNALTDFITLLSWSQAPEKANLTQQMQQLYITEPVEEPGIAMEVINPVEKYLDIFRIAERIFNTISPLGDI